MHKQDLHIKSILYRFLRDKTTETEKVQVQEWLEESEDNANFFLSLKRLYTQESHEDFLPKDEITEQWSKLKVEIKPAKKHSRSLLALMQVAAIAILLMGVGSFFYFQNSTPETLEYFTQAGERKSITLDDGTVVWMNAASSLVLDEKFGKKQRQVTLVGEAWFDVAKNQNKPFIVSTTDINVKVHGTQFNIEAYEWQETINTSLEEGSISLYASNESPLILIPGDVVKYNRSSHELTKSNDINTLHSVWRAGVLLIENQSIESTIHHLENYYNIDIACHDKLSTTDSINMTINGESISETIELLEMLTKNKFEIQEN